MLSKVSAHPSTLFLTLFNLGWSADLSSSNLSILTAHVWILNLCHLQLCLLCHSIFHRSLMELFTFNLATVLLWHSTHESCVNPFSINLKHLFFFVADLHVPSLQYRPWIFRFSSICLLKLCRELLIKNQQTLTVFLKKIYICVKSSDYIMELQFPQDPGTAPWNMLVQQRFNTDRMKCSSS